jgi:ABC-type branched-subunit amino acid transport system ATPase component
VHLHSSHQHFLPVMLALKHASYGYVPKSGRIVEEGEAGTLLDRENLSQRYLGRATAVGE